MSNNKTKSFLGFIQDESFSGVVLMAATAIAIWWANSGFADGYSQIWTDTYFNMGIGELQLSKPLFYWINDGLMAIFFFVIGLEIKRELIVGNLSSFKKAGLPLIAALGGMVVPALIFFLMNHDDQVYRNGWAIPMATDIAFALGILAMMGKRVPIGLKIFLTALAIVDDLGAVLSIAIFYTDTIHWAYLGFAGFIIILLFVLNRVGVRKIWVYLILGLVGVWYPLLMSGVHATIAGVLVALTIPANRKIRSSVFGKNLKTLIVEYGKLFDSEDNRVMSGNQMETIGSMKRICEQAESPLQKIEHILKPLALFVVMPLFALANTGIHFSFQDVGEVIIHPVFTGIAFGLIIGKSLGIFGFSWLAIKLKWVEIPDGVRLKQLFGAGLLAGIGFTMSLFITDLAFHGDALQIIAKKAIFLSSLIAGLVGMIWLRIVSKPSR